MRPAGRRDTLARLTRSCLLLPRQGADVTAVSLHPGVGYTGLGKEGLPRWARATFRVLSTLFMASWEQLAATSVHCALAEAGELEPGGYYARCAEKAESSEGRKAATPT